MNHSEITWQRIRDSQLFWPLLALALIMLFNLIFTPGFYDIEIKDGHLSGFLIDILNRGSILMVLAIGMTMVIATAKRRGKKIGIPKEYRMDGMPDEIEALSSQPGFQRALAYPDRCRSPGRFLPPCHRFARVLDFLARGRVSQQKSPTAGTRVAAATTIGKQVNFGLLRHAIS